MTKFAQNATYMNSTINRAHKTEKQTQKCKFKIKNTKIKTGKPEINLKIS